MFVFKLARGGGGEGGGWGGCMCVTFYFLLTKLIFSPWLQEEDMGDD